jgi:hypothetical protein
VTHRRQRQVALQEGAGVIEAREGNQRRVRHLCTAPFGRRKARIVLSDEKEGPYVHCGGTSSRPTLLLIPSVNAINASASFASSRASIDADKGWPHVWGMKCGSRRNRSIHAWANAGSRLYGLAPPNVSE